MKLKYPVYQPSLSGNEKKYVMECLDSTWISSKGKFINQFEERFSEFLDIKYSAAVSNGTVALHTALLALGIGQGDEVIVRSDDVPDPVAVRYGWAMNPVCNLYNREGLPASPFRTDDWPGITVNNKQFYYRRLSFHQ